MFKRADCCKHALEEASHAISVAYATLMTGQHLGFSAPADYHRSTTRSIGELGGDGMTDGWPNGVCVAPGTIADAFSGGSSTQIDPAPADMGAQAD
jgi:hypothetical protein